MTGSILDFAKGMEEDARSQHSGGTEDPESQASGSGRAPSFAASQLSCRSLETYRQSVRINMNSEVGSTSWRHKVPTPGLLGYGVLARPTLGVITEIDPKEAAREKSLAETMESLIGKPPRSYDNTITLRPVGFVLAQGVYHPATPWSLKEVNSVEQ